MTEKKLKVEVNREFLENIIKYQETQRTRTNEIIKTFSGKDFDSFQFTLLCEHMVLLNGYIEMLDDTILSSESRVVEDDDEKEEHIILEEEVMMASHEIQKALDEHEYQLTGYGISFLTH
jgi:hypothetical protein